MQLAAKVLTNAAVVACVPIQLIAKAQHTYTHARICERNLPNVRAGNGALAQRLLLMSSLLGERVRLHSQFANVSLIFRAYCNLFCY